MNSIEKYKVNYGLGIIFIIIMLIAPDLIINLVLELLHFVWEILAETFARTQKKSYKNETIQHRKSSELGN